MRASVEESESIVIDTSAFFALGSFEDRFHNQAREAFWDLLARGHLLTTSYVLVETQALVIRRLGFEAVRTLFSAIAGLVEVVWVDEVLHSEAWDRLQARRAVGLSFVDWTVALTAVQRNASVFAFDADFRSEGLQVIPGRP
jgi:predicted nucleic acid-binding protein